MTSEFPGRPKLIKGALVAYESQFLGPIPNVIVFQYNPAELTRSLSDRQPQRATGAEGAKAAAPRLEDVLRVQGPPVETFRASVELDAADQLEQPAAHPHVAAFGLHPALAALELLLYPPSSQVLLNLAALELGTFQVARDAEEVPLVLFIWGLHRVLPVRLTSLSITEQAFGPHLNPLRATVELELRVLTYQELSGHSVARGAYVASLAQKEVLARLNLVSSAQEIVGMLPF